MVRVTARRDIEEKLSIIALLKILSVPAAKLCNDVAVVFPPSQLVGVALPPSYKQFFN